MVLVYLACFCWLICEGTTLGEAGRAVVSRLVALPRAQPLMVTMDGIMHHWLCGAGSHTYLVGETSSQAQPRPSRPVAVAPEAGGFRLSSLAVFSFPFCFPHSSLYAVSSPTHPVPDDARSSTVDDTAEVLAKLRIQPRLPPLPQRKHFCCCCCSRTSIRRSHRAAEAPHAQLEQGGSD